MLRDIKSSNIIEKVSTGASILGLMVLGVLVASWINIKTVLELVVKGPNGDVVTNLQSVLDGIIPGLLGLGLTMLIVFMMRRKWATTKLIGLIFVAAFVLYALKIAA